MDDLFLSLAHAGQSTHARTMPSIGDGNAFEMAFQGVHVASARPTGAGGPLLALPASSQSSEDQIEEGLVGSLSPQSDIPAFLQPEVAATTDGPTSTDTVRRQVPTMANLAFLLKNAPSGSQSLPGLAQPLTNRAPASNVGATQVLPDLLTTDSLQMAQGLLGIDGVVAATPGPSSIPSGDDPIGDATFPSRNAAELSLSPQFISGLSPDRTDIADSASTQDQPEIHGATLTNTTDSLLIVAATKRPDLTSGQPLILPATTQLPVPPTLGDNAGALARNGEALATPPVQKGVGSGSPVVLPTTHDMPVPVDARRGEGARGSIAGVIPRPAFAAEPTGPDNLLVAGNRTHSWSATTPQLPTGSVPMPVNTQSMQPFSADQSHLSQAQISQSTSNPLVSAPPLVPESPISGGHQLSATTPANLGEASERSVQFSATSLASISSAAPTLAPQPASEQTQRPIPGPAAGTISIVEPPITQPQTSPPPARHARDDAPMRATFTVGAPGQRSGSWTIPVTGSQSTTTAMTNAFQAAGTGSATSADQGVNTLVAAESELNLPAQLTQSGIIASTPAMTHTPPAMAQSAAQQIAVALANPTRDTDAPLELALDPPELGRVRLQITELAGILTLTIHTERPETADLMRRHLDLLAQEFAQSDLDAPSVRISQDGAGGDGAQSRGREDTAPTDTNLPEADTTPQSRSRTPDGGLDLRL